MTDIHTIHRQTICIIENCDKPRQPTYRMCQTHRNRVARYGDPHHVATGRVAGDPAARFWSKVPIAGDDECWHYQGTILSNGYGQFRVDEQVRTGAHRFAYEDRVGPIPPGLTVDHLCCVRACVNPAHMEIVTASENVRRRWERQRAASA